MITILRLTTGEDLIGEIEEDWTQEDEYCNLVHPMVIVSARDETGGAMKLRDFFLLSEETLLSVPMEFILTWYEPTHTLQEYYKKASYYSRTFTKVMVDEQIRYATQELEEMIAEESKEATKLTDILMKATGSRLQ